MSKLEVHGTLYHTAGHCSSATTRSPACDIRLFVLGLLDVKLYDYPSRRSGIAVNHQRCLARAKAKLGIAALELMRGRV